MAEEYRDGNEDACIGYVTYKDFDVCFQEGTLISTDEGQIPIEEVTVGTFVWATNEETGEKELKEVIRLFRNETDEWIHLTVDGEEIVCAPEHPFYVPGDGWVSACDLSAGTVLATIGGEYVVLEEIWHELLVSPEITYNFEVESFHTYYVGSTEVLVHNRCKPQSPSKVSKQYIESSDIDAHAFKHKAGGIPNSQMSKYDIYKDTADNGKLWVGDKAGKIWKETECFFEDLITDWRK